MTKFKKFMLFACVVCMLAGVALLSTGCNDEPDPTTTAATKVPSRNYTITVRTAGGLLLKDVTVYVYADATKSDLADLPKKLDSEGKYSFVGPQSDTYTVVLQGVPAGYDVQEQYTLTGTEMEILLTSAPIAGEVPANTTYNLGDIIHDYTFTTIDGQSYTISQILENKNAVVLNFWFVGCHFCKEEFPYLQAAYEKYGDNVEVLALDVEDDKDADIRKVIADYGLTFPVAKVDASLLTAMKAGACPTTVVIDRFGMITYLYTGALTDPAAFPALLRHFGAEDYIQATVSNAADLIQEEDIPYGCEQYPYAVGALSEYLAEVRADELVYYTLYRIASATLRIEDPDVYLVYDGEPYYPVDGVLEMNFDTDGIDSFSGVTIALGTTGGVDKEVNMLQIPQEGSSENPYQLNLGDFAIAADGKDAYYMFTSEYTGTLTITMDALPAGMFCRVNMTNMRTYAVTDSSSEESIDPETGKVTFSIAVEAGDSVRLIIGTYGELTEDMVIQALASIPEVEGGGGSEETTYSVFVINESGTPMANVEMTVVVDGVTHSYFTDADGVAVLDLKDGTYSMNLVLPEGYYATQKYLLTPAKKELDIMLVSARDYAIQVSITGGELTEVVTVRVYANDTLEELIYSGTLDENGEVHFTYGYIDGCVAVLEGLPSNVYVQSSYPLTEEVTQIALVRTSIGDTNASNQKYQLGDKIPDFSITTPDGRTYTLTEVLQQKKAVLLTFWHCGNAASAQTLQALQSIYTTYGEQLEILAMNPLDTSDLDISAFQATYGIGFPMANCSNQWEAAFQMTVYPTLVMIDRDGTVCLIHSGNLTDETVLTQVAEHYIAADYVTTVVSSIDQLLPQNAQNGTEENPYVVAKGTTTLSVTLGAGEVAYFTFEEVEPLSILAEGDLVYMILDGQIYGGDGGPVQIIINVDGTQQQKTVVIGNASQETAQIQITLTVLAAG